MYYYLIETSYQGMQFNCHKVDMSSCALVLLGEKNPAVLAHFKHRYLHF